jgi:hypothetical protein
MAKLQNCKTIVVKIAQVVVIALAVALVYCQAKKKHLTPVFVAVRFS